MPDVRSDIKYDITNAYKSIFKIGSDENKSQMVKYNKSLSKDTSYTKGAVNIDLTGKKVYTYDNDGTLDGKRYNPKLEKMECVCPVLFDFALKIGTAQNYALQNGYCLKIYDAYRPKVDGGEKLSNGTKNAYDTSAKAKALIDTVVNGSYYKGVSWFVQTPGSAYDHARGVAIDVTMVFKGTNTEIISQSDMHDLSTNAAKFTNLANKSNVANWGTYYTDILDKIMQECTGLEALPSEWWHYNIKQYDDRSKNKNYIKNTFTLMEKNIKYTDQITFNKKSITYTPSSAISNESVTVTITSNKQIKTIPSGWSYVSNSNNKKIYKKYTSSEQASSITLKDYSGKELKVSINKIVIGKTVPQITKVTATDGTKIITNSYSNNKLQGNDNISKNWFKGDVTLTVEAQDAESGIKSYWITGTKTQTKKITSTTKQAKLTVYDNADNSRAIYVDIQIDKTKPTLQLSSYGEKGVSKWVNPQVEASKNRSCYISLNPSDGQIGSGIKMQYKYRIDGGQWQTGYARNSNNELVYCFKQNGKYEFKIEDNAGNESSIYPINITKVDKTCPIIFASGGNGKLTIKAEDAGSGLSKYTIDGKTWLSWPSGKTGVQINKENTTIKAGTIKVKDVAENETSWNKQINTGVSTKFETKAEYSNLELTKNPVTVTIISNKKVDESSIPSGWKISTDKLKITKS